MCTSAHPVWLTTQDEKKLSRGLVETAICDMHLLCLLQMCFWVEREVLDERNLKLRADMVGFFIRVAKVSPSSLQAGRGRVGGECGLMLIDVNVF